MSAAQSTTPETDAEAQARHLAQLKRVADLGMEMAERAATQHAAAEPGSPERAEASLDFARATHTARQAIALEQRARAGNARRRLAPRFVPHDPRRAPLREYLYRFSNGKPDRATRNEIRRQVDEQIEEHLQRDPDPTRAPYHTYVEICRLFGYSTDLSKVSDAFLGMPPRPTRPPEDEDSEDEDSEDEDPNPH